MSDIVKADFGRGLSIGDRRAIALHNWSCEHPGATAAELKAEMERLKRAMPSPEDALWKIPSPRDYLAIKYSAPPGACKCGECQLVPSEMLMTWDAEINALRDYVKQLRIIRP